MSSRKGKRRVSIDRSTLISIIRDLNTMVVSLDRIGSSFADPKACDKATLRFLDDWWICPKLLEMRSHLHDLFSDKLGPDGMDELEREMRDVSYWSQKHPKPPREYIRQIKRQRAKLGSRS